MKKQELFRVPLSSELITEDICSELLEEFYYKIDEWRENMDRAVQVTSPFPNNPPDLDSTQFYMNVKRWTKICSFGGGFHSSFSFPPTLHAKTDVCVLMGEKEKDPLISMQTE